MVDDISRQVEEIEALCSIYGTDWKTEDEVDRSYSITVNDGNHSVVLYVTLPLDYPSSSPPKFLLSAPLLGAQDKQLIYSQLNHVYLENIGETVIFQWVEKVRELLQQFHTLEIPNEEQSSEETSACAVVPQEHIPGPAISHGSAITDRKSVFQGHAAKVTFTEQVSQVLQELYENKKIANATHNMYAYRIYKEDIKCFIQDCNDDGEAQAGSRLLHLLQILELQNVIVVVTRWYGGVHLGPDRFRHINNAARQVLDLAGFIQMNKNQKKNKKNM